MSTFNTAEAVSQEIQTRLQAVLIANGFQTNMGQRVYLGKLAIEDQHVPCVSVVEGIDNVNPSDSRKNPTALVKQQYALVGYAVCDPDHPNETAHKIIRDIKRAIFKGSNSDFGGKVSTVRYIGRNIGPRADGAAVVQAVVEIEVAYVEDLGNP